MNKKASAGVDCRCLSIVAKNGTFPLCDFHVVINVLNVLVLLDHVDEFLDRSLVFRREFLQLAVGETLEGSRHDLVVVGLEILLDLVHGGELAVDHDYLRIVVLVGVAALAENVLSAVVDQFELQLVKVDVVAVLDLEDALAVEHEFYAA